MRARSKARKRALDLLFEADLRGLEPLELLTGPQAAPEQAPSNSYTAVLVEGVVEHRARIDELITRCARGWVLSRMPPIDRAVLRLGLYELLWADDVPPAVAIDEAVELAKTLSTEDSPRFVNGVLAAAQHGADRGAADQQAQDSSPAG